MNKITIYDKLSFNSKGCRAYIIVHNEWCPNLRYDSLGFYKVRVPHKCRRTSKVTFILLLQNSATNHNAVKVLHVNKIIFMLQNNLHISGDN